MAGRAKRNIRSVDALRKMGAQVVGARGEDGKTSSRIVVSCHSCDNEISFSAGKAIAPDHLTHMASDKGWTFDKRGATCDRCQGKGKSADVIHLQYTPETTFGATPQPGEMRRLYGAGPLPEPAGFNPVIPSPLPGLVVERAVAHRALADTVFAKPTHRGRADDPAFHAEIRPFLEEGWTNQDIGDLAGCSRDLIRRARLAMGIPKYGVIRRQRKGKTDMGEVHPMPTTPAIPPQPQTAPSIRETVLISEKLDAFFDQAAGRYKAPWTDQKVGEALSLPAAKVAAVREALDLHIKADPELQAIRDELAAVKKLVADLEARLERAERKAAEGNIR